MSPKFLRKIFHHAIAPDDRARFLVEDAVEHAFKFFQDKTFRKEIKFDEMEQIEQDRVFNELEVTFVGFLYLLIENTLDYLPAERKDYWHSVKSSVFPRFINWFKELGIEDEHIQTWEKLNDLRLDEYRLGLKETEKIWRSEIGKHNEDEKLQDETILLGAIVISAMLHIRRGQSSPTDPLKKMLGTQMGLMAQDWINEIR